MDVVDVLLQTLTGVPNPLANALQRNMWLMGWEALWVAEMSFLPPRFLALSRIEWEEEGRTDDGRQQKTRNCSRKVARARLLTRYEKLQLFVSTYSTEGTAKIDLKMTLHYN